MLAPRSLLFACSLLALGACGSSPDDADYYADPEAVAEPIDAQAFWLERRPGYELEQLLVGEAVPRTRRHPRDPELLAAGRSFLKIGTHAEMRRLIEALTDLDFDRLARPAPAPGAIQVLGLVLDEQVRYVSILPPRDIRDMDADELAVRKLRDAFLQQYSRILFLDTGSMTKEEFEREQRRLSERNENRRDRIQRRQDR